MKHTHKSGASFELPEDISQKQLETWERVATESLGNEKRTDGRMARASVQAGFEAGFITPGDGVPKNKEELVEFKSSKVLWWMGSKIGQFIHDLKVIDPN